MTWTVRRIAGILLRGPGAPSQGPGLGLCSRHSTSRYRGVVSRPRCVVSRSRDLVTDPGTRAPGPGAASPPPRTESRGPGALSSRPRTAARGARSSNPIPRPPVLAPGLRLRVPGLRLGSRNCEMRSRGLASESRDAGRAPERFQCLSRYTPWKWEHRPWLYRSALSPYNGLPVCYAGPRRWRLKCPGAASRPFWKKKATST